MKSRHKQAHRPPQLIIVTGAILILLAVAVVNAEAQKNEMQGNSQNIADTKIEMAIYRELKLDDGVAAQLIDVQSIDGVVTLIGSVDNLLARQRAADIAMSIKGVRSVANAVNVKPMLRSAENIQSDVQHALLTDPATDAYEITVTATQGGVVSLRGTVDSWAEQQLSLEVASGVLGVREVQDKITVARDNSRSDSEILEDVLGRLQNDVRVDDGLIETHVQDGTVTLSGSVGSAAERQRAVSNAWVLGADTVEASNLEVRWWLRDDMRRTKEFEERSDEEVKEAIKAAFLYDPRVALFKVDVDVNRGVATLTGRVATLKSKQAAEETATNTFGVWRVRNYLLVRTDKQIDDRELEAEIRGALERNPYATRRDIELQAMNGAVTLRGVADSQFQKEQILDAVAGVEGVLDLREFIHVDYSWSYKNDWHISEDIKDELWWSPFVDSDDVNVSVEDGVATLTGTVDDWSEWLAAADNAYDGGARKVRNKLDVRDWPPFAVN